MLLSDVCLSVAYIGPKSRTERHRKTKIGTEVAHVTRNSNTTFKVKRSKLKATRPLYSLPCWHVRQLQRWAWERVDREKLMLRCRLLGARAASAPTWEGRGIPWRPPAYSLFETTRRHDARRIILYEEPTGRFFFFYRRRHYQPVDKVQLICSGMNCQHIGLFVPYISSAKVCGGFQFVRLCVCVYVSRIY